MRYGDIKVKKGENQVAFDAGQAIGAGYTKEELKALGGGDLKKGIQRVRDEVIKSNKSPEGAQYLTSFSSAKNPRGKRALQEKLESIGGEKKG